MRLSELDASTKVELHINGNNQQLVEELTLAETQPFDDIVLFKVLYKNGKLLGLKNSENIRFSVLFVEDSTAWEVTSAKINTVSYNGAPYYRIDDEDVKKLNRRAAYRVYLGTNMYVRLVSSHDEILKVEVRDISETGFSFYSKENLPLKSKVVLNFHYGDIACALYATVVRKVDEGNRTLYGCKLSSDTKNMGKLMVKIQREKRFG